MHLLWLAPLCGGYALFGAWTLDTIDSTFERLRRGPDQVNSARARSPEAPRQEGTAKIKEDLPGEALPIPPVRQARAA